MPPTGAATPDPPFTSGPPPPPARRYVPTPAAYAVLAQLAIETAAGATPGIAAARALAGHEIEWRPLRADILGSERAIVLAGGEPGPALAARAFHPGQPTAVHDHGCAGAAILVEGRQRYQRFTPDGSGQAIAHLTSTWELGLGDVVGWEGPPDDIHRQVALGSAAIELVLLCGPIAEAVTYSPVGEL